MKILKKYLEHSLFLSQIQQRQMGNILQQLFWYFNIKLVQTPVSDFHTHLDFILGDQLCCLWLV